MKLHAITVPDDPARLAGWLEEHLVGPDLGALVAELTAVHQPAGATPSLADVLGAATVQERGLAALPADRLRKLLTHPRLLLELQELLLTSESAYWENALAQAAPLEDLVQRGRQRCRPAAAPGTLTLPEPERPRQSWYRQSWFASLVTAAAVLLAVAGYQHFAVQPAAVQTAWGWNKPGALREDGPASAYLDRLAAGADEWFDKTPENPTDLARRLGELRTGCAQLIVARHQPLSAADRLWLVDSCRRWAAQFDKQMAGLESGQSVQEVRAQTDATVSSMTKALRQRAAST